MGHRTRTRSTHISLDLTGPVPADLEITYERRRTPKPLTHLTERHIVIPPPAAMPAYIPTTLPPPRITYSHPPAPQHYYLPAPPPQIVYAAPAPPPPAPLNTDDLANRIAARLVAEAPPPAPAPVHLPPSPLPADLAATRKALREQQRKVAALHREQEQRDEADRERGRRARLRGGDEEENTHGRRARSVSVSFSGRGSAASVAADENGTRVVVRQTRWCENCRCAGHWTEECREVVRREELEAWAHARSRSVNVGYGEERRRGGRYIGWGSQY